MLPDINQCDENNRIVLLRGAKNPFQFLSLFLTLSPFDANTRNTITISMDASFSAYQIMNELFSVQRGVGSKC